MIERFKHLDLDDNPVPSNNLENTQEEAPIIQAEPSKLRVTEVMGELGNGVGQFNRPAGLAIDQDGAVYVADSSNHRIQRIAENGDVFLYGGPGSGLGQLMGPTSVALHPDGLFMYVADQGNRRISCYYMNGSPGTALYGYISPCSIAFDEHGMLWIADPGRNEIRCLNLNTNTIMKTMGRESGLIHPVGLAFDLSGNLFVLDSFQNLLIKYDSSANHSFPLGDFHRPAGAMFLSITAAGLIFLPETFNNRLHLFSYDGRSLADLTHISTRHGQLNSPTGIALSKDGSVYMSDSLNHRILHIQAE